MMSKIQLSESDTAQDIARKIQKAAAVYRQVSGGEPVRMSVHPSDWKRVTEDPYEVFSHVGLVQDQSVTPGTIRVEPGGEVHA